ncbi:Uncharacterised protein [Mycoplasmopsis citelli]|uniref:Uncharacterized protein n=1 Tax=Mycoplasmopsis citelli TaxID=171281 RepID=A0A449B2K4_9BACT|nr:Uncharacterised protein [Mycoplasmopsis citelli]
MFSLIYLSINEVKIIYYFEQLLLQIKKLSIVINFLNF